MNKTNNKQLFTFPSKVAKNVAVLRRRKSRLKCDNNSLSLSQSIGPQSEQNTLGEKEDTLYYVEENKASK